MLTVGAISRRIGRSGQSNTAVQITDRGNGSVRVLAHNRDSLRRAVTSSADRVELITHCQVEVRYAKAPAPGWMASPGVRTLSYSLQWSESGFLAELNFGQPVALSVALAAVVRMCTPLPTGTSTPDIAWTPSALPVSGLASETLTTLISEKQDPHLRFTDVAVTDSTVVNVGHGSLIQITDHRWVGPTIARDVWVDPLVHRPVGRRSTTEVTLVPVSSIELPDYLDTPAVRAIKDVTAISGSAVLTEQQRRQLQACGVVLTDTAMSPSDLQAVSVAGRSTALRHFTAQPLIYGWPSVTMLLVTHRPDFLHRIVEMLSQQTYPVLELVVLTHGFDLDDHIASHLRELRYPVVHQQMPSSMNLGELLAVGSALASGELLTKIDDDDFYGPEHVWDLVVARMYSGAQIVGKALDYIYLAAQDTTVFRPTYAAEKYTDFVAGGTILISQGDLRSVGGWRPVPKSVDRALLDRVLDHQGLIYRTHGRGYIYVRHGTVAPESSLVNTSVVSDSHFETKTESVFAGLDRSVLADYGMFT